MYWKFWKRKNKNNKPVLPEWTKAQVQVGEVEIKNSKTNVPLLNSGSSTELLVLQRLVGNQAVLQMVRARPAPNDPSDVGCKTN